MCIRDSRRPVERAVGTVDPPLAASDREGVCREPQVGLGLAASGGEEEQLDPPETVAGALRRSRIAQRGQLQQDEGDLEGTPRVRLGLSLIHI